MWMQEQWDSFQRIKATVSELIMLTYPNVNKTFVIYTYVSDYAVGGIVTQDGHVISCFSKMLSPTQQKYDTMDKELLAVEKMLKQHHNIIYGCEVILQKDHKNLCHHKTKHTNQQVLCK